MHLHTHSWPADGFDCCIKPHVLVPSLAAEDGSGTLTVDELMGRFTNPSTGTTAMGTTMTIQEATLFVCEFDENKDGQLDFDE